MDIFHVKMDDLRLVCPACLIGLKGQIESLKLYPDFVAEKRAELKDIYTKNILRL